MKILTYILILIGLISQGSAFTDNQEIGSIDSPDGILIIADQSGHFIQHDEPELVLMAIQYVVDKSQIKE